MSSDGIANILAGICSQFPPGDPNANKLLYWNDTTNQFDFLGIGSGLSISGGNLVATGGGTVTSITSTGSTLTVTGTTTVNVEINLAHANTWTGLQTDSRAGSSSLGLGTTNPMLVLNKSSSTYGLLAFQSAGSTVAGIAWDVNTGITLLSGGSGIIKGLFGSTEIFQFNNFGLALNRAGGGPSATLDVNGTFLVTSIPANTVPFVDGNSGYMTGDVTKLVYSGVGFFGVNQSGPEASADIGVLTRTVGDVSGFSGFASPITTGFPIGFSNEGYSAWAVRLVGATNIFSSNAATTNVSEPSIDNYDPTSGSASEISGSGYDTAVDPPPSVEIIALYDSNGCRSSSSTTAALGSWSGGNPFADAQYSFTPPMSGSPSAILLIRNSSDYQLISGSATNFIDNNTGWIGGVPSYSVLQWAINLSFSSVTSATDYVVANTTNTSYVNTSGSTSVQDISSWGGGTPSVTPTSLDETCFITRGTTYIAKASGGVSFFNVAAVGQQTSGTELTLGLQNLGLFQNSGSGSYDINVNALTASNATLGTTTMNSGFTSNSTSAVNGQLTATTLIASNQLVMSGVAQMTLVINNTSTGTINNASTSAASRVDFSGASQQILTGLGNPTNGKLVFSANRAATALVLKHLNAGSSAGNKFITPTGLDYNIAAGSGFIVAEDPTSAAWRIHGISVADLTSNVVGILPLANGGIGAATLLGAGITSIITTIAATNQGADIAAANLATVAGLYRVSYCLEDTAADVSAGIVTLTLSFTDGAGATTVTTTQTLAATGRSSGTAYIQLASGNLTYATTHTGIFGTGKYALYITTERLN